MTNNNLDGFFVELSDTEMATATGGVSRRFLNRWARRTIAGTPNLPRIAQGLVNRYYKGTLTVSSQQTWAATTKTANKDAWKVAAPLVSSTLTSGIPIAGATPDAISAVRSYLVLF